MRKLLKKDKQTLLREKNNWKLSLIRLFVILVFVEWNNRCCFCHTLTHPFKGIHKIRFRFFGAWCGREAFCLFKFQKWNRMDSHFRQWEMNQSQRQSDFCSSAFANFFSSSKAKPKAAKNSLTLTNIIHHNSPYFSPQRTHWFWYVSQSVS